MARRRLLDKLKVFAKRLQRTSADLYLRRLALSSEQAHGFIFLPSSFKTLPSSRFSSCGEPFDADCAKFSIHEKITTAFCADISPWKNSCIPAFSNLKVPSAETLSGGSRYHLHHHVQSSSSLFCYAQKRFMSTPKIKLKVDRFLDAHTETDKLLRPMFKIRTLILRQEDHAIKVKYLDIKRKNIGLASKPVGMKAYLKKFPNMFELFSYPNEIQLWCRLSKTMEDLLEEERRIYLETEDQVVIKLRKLLMMSKDRCLKAGKIDFARRAFGFPEDFATRIAPAYPQYFRVVGSGPSPFIELVSWDEKIAISELEKKAKEEALKAGCGEIETRGQPLAFKVTHSPGMFLKKKNMELLEKWQKLPYVSPYQDYSWVTSGTALSEKRVAAVLHELLSLTIEKRALMQVLGRFREEFGLPQSIGKLVNRFPGIFYLSLIGNVKTVFLREGYARSQFIENHIQRGKAEARVIEDHPLLRWRMKIAQMAREGPRLYAAQKEKANAGRKQGVDNVSDSDDDEDEAASAATDSDSMDFECDEADSEEECDEDEVDDSEEEGEKKMKMQTRQLKPKKEIW